MNEKKILIAVPCMDQLPARFAQCLAMLKKVGQCAVAFQVGSLVYMSRNDLARRAIEMDADFIFWLDSDMVFDPDVLERLMKHFNNPDVDMVTGIYYRRVPPFSPVLFKSLEFEDGKATKWEEYDDPQEDGLFEIAACGFGCVLMRTEVAMSVQGRFGNMFAPIGDTGEDLAFRHRATECGFKIYCDPSFPLGHVGQQIITRGYWEQYREQLKGDKT